MNKFYPTVLLVMAVISSMAQNTTQLSIDILNPANYSQTSLSVDANLSYKVTNALTEYNNNLGTHLFSRTIRVEEVIGRSISFNDMMTNLSLLEDELISLSQKSEKLIIPIARMPQWLSKSSDASPVLHRGWFHFQTEGPTDINIWRSSVFAIVNKIVNEFQITNACFEIWDEPDYFTWSGTEEEFYALYKVTYDAIKQAAPNANIGTPALYTWAGNFQDPAQKGYQNISRVENTIVYNLIDSAVVWNKALDFVSVKYYQDAFNTQQMTTEIGKIFNLVGHNKIPIYVTAWNQSDTFLESKYSASALFATQVLFEKDTFIKASIIDSWTDKVTGAAFKKSTGLLNENLMPKPVYFSAKMMSMLPSTRIKVNKQESRDLVIASAEEDTLYIMLSNYVPDPTTEAINSAMYHNNISLQDMQAAGIINLSGDYYSRLDSIYRGYITLSGSNPAEDAVISSTATFGYYDLLANSGQRTFDVNIQGASINIPVKIHRVDKNNNNTIALYDSLITWGYSKAQAIDSIRSFMDLKPDSIMYVGSNFEVKLSPNDVMLLKLKIPELLPINSLSSIEKLSIYPNPTQDVIYFDTEAKLERYTIYTVDGQLVESNTLSTSKLMTHHLPPGSYILFAIDDRQKAYSATFLKK